MKKDLAAILVCPECQGKFALKVFKEKPCGEIVDGIFICLAKGHWYPVISSIPRIFVGSYRGEIYQQYPDYFIKYNLDLPEFKNLTERKVAANPLADKLKMTARVFSFEWQKFSDYSLDNLNGFLSPHLLDNFTGKLCLDAGCGGGRHILQCAEKADTIIGVDLSKPVEEANKRLNSLNNAHILQADIFKLPFKEGSFDLVYSLGVLHHLSEPQKGFNCLVDLLKDNGEIYIWVYKKSLRKIILKKIRWITTKLPLRIVYHLAFGLALLGYFGIIFPSRVLINKFFIFKKITPAHIREYAKYNFKIYLTDWFDRLSAPIANYYSPEEIEDWFRAKKCSEIQIRTIDSFWCYGYAKK